MKVYTTGIGSLPHINVDSAIEYSFRFDIPFLPQLPVYNPNEYMLYQSLSALPGIIKPKNGIVLLNLKVWAQKRRLFLAQVELANKTKDYSSFLPSSDAWKAFSAFLFEIRERKPEKVKLQICGPFTCLQMLKLDDNSRAIDISDLRDDVLVCLDMLTKAILSEFSKLQTELYFFIDEPGLTLYHPDGTEAYQKLNLIFDFVNEQKKLFKVHRWGIHCCGNTDWKQLFSKESPFDLISFDYDASFHSLPKDTPFLEKWMPGVVSTTKNLNDDIPLHAQSLKSLLLKTTDEILLSPACGLAHLSLLQSEDVYDRLRSEKLEFLKHR